MKTKKKKKKNSRKTTGGVEGIYFPATHFPPFKLWFNLADVHKTCVCVCVIRLCRRRPDQTERFSLTFFKKKEFQENKIFL